MDRGWREVGFFSHHKRQDSGKDFHCQLEFQQWILYSWKLDKPPDVHECGGLSGFIRLGLLPPGWGLLPPYHPLEVSSAPQAEAVEVQSPPAVSPLR